jgi:hypothetical protein
LVNEFVVRIGTFFILVGTGLLILFVASDYAGSANFDYLFWAALSVTLGILLRRRKSPAPSSGRFASLRKFRGPPHDRKDR